MCRDVFETPIDSNDILVPHFIAGERFPFRSPYLRLTILGLDLEHSRKHLVRASFEGVVYVLKSIAAALIENGVNIEEVHCGGGGCSIQTLVNIVSNVLGIPIVIYRDDVSCAISALGTVSLLLKALGHFNDIYIRSDLK